MRKRTFQLIDGRPAEYNLAQMMKRLDVVEEVNRKLTNENQLLAQRIDTLEGIVKDQASHEDLVTWKTYEENFDVLFGSCHPSIHELFLTSILKFEGKVWHHWPQRRLSPLSRSKEKTFSQSGISFPSTLPQIYNLIFRRRIILRWAQIINSSDFPFWWTGIDSIPRK